MNAERLKTFHQVAVQGSFTKAARELHLTQPAVSQQVQALESSLGTMLFDRSARHIRLTSEGKILLAYTRKLFDLYREISVHFSHLHDLTTGLVSIGATALVGTYLLPLVTSKFSKKYPGVDLDMYMANSHKVHNRLLDGEIDLALAGRLDTPASLSYTLVHRERLVLVTSADNPLAGKSVTNKDLKTNPFIWREPGTQTRAILESWFDKLIGREHPIRSIELQNFEAAKRTVVEGYGITALPATSIKRELHMGLLKELKHPDFNLSFDYFLLLVKNRTISKAAIAFLEVLGSLSLLTHGENIKKMLNSGMSSNMNIMHPAR